jgi:hypothetical protein
MISTNSLKQKLVDSYGGFADRRIKKLESGSWFEVDSRSARDYGADKKLFGWFCTINVEVVSGEEVIVVIGSALPTNADVQRWMQRHQVPTGRYERPGIIVRHGEQAKLTELAGLVDQIVKRPYAVKAYKFVVPATSQALRRLDSVLSDAWFSSD